MALDSSSNFSDTSSCNNSSSIEKIHYYCTVANRNETNCNYAPRKRLKPTITINNISNVVPNDKTVPLTKRKYITIKNYDYINPSTSSYSKLNGLSNIYPDSRVKKKNIISFKVISSSPSKVNTTSQSNNYYEATSSSTEFPSSSDYIIDTSLSTDVTDPIVLLGSANETEMTNGSSSGSETQSLFSSAPAQSVKQEPQDSPDRNMEYTCNSITKIHPVRLFIKFTFIRKNYIYYN